MRRAVTPLVLLVATLLSLSTPLPAAAQEEDQGPASLTLCNKGTRTVNVALGMHDMDLTAPSLQVVAWQVVKAGECKDVYDSTSINFVPLPAYLAFAFIGPQGQVTPARVASIPDIGAWEHRSFYMSTRFPSGHGPGLTRSSRQLCVNAGRQDYTVPFNAAVNCASQGAQGARSPITAQILFHPSARTCVSNVAGDLLCSGGRYYLDVAPKTGDLELHATHGDHADESVVKPLTPEQIAAGLANGAREVTAIANAIVNGRPVPGSRGDEPLDFSQKRARWWTSATRQAASYQANWIGQIVVVRGTVASIGGDGMDAAIVLKESPKTALTICPQYPNRLRQVYGEDLNVLVGKAIEVTGEVERYEPCGTGATIRIFEVEQFRVTGAR